MRPFSSALAIAGTSIGVLLIACVGDEPMTRTSVPDASTSSGSGSGDGSTSGGSSGTASGDACAVTCNGQCVDTQTDPANCGACGTTCQRDSGTFACVAGKCGRAIASVAGGTYAGCILLLEGSVWCWGGRDTGLTGEPATSVPTPSPREVAGLTDITQVSIGNEHACARRKDGAVLCWGANSRGQTGSASNANDCTGPNNAFCHKPRVVPFPAGVKIAQVSAGLNVTCARTEGAGGDVYCWGQNAAKLISAATNDTNDVQGPTRIAPTVFNLDVVDVRVGFHDGSSIVRQHACALKSDKTVWCWGSNNRGQLGHTGGTDTTCAGSGTTGSVTCNPVPEQVKISGQALANAKSVYAMTDASCTLKEDKTVWCWGSRFYGQSGLTTGDEASAQQVSGLGTTELFEARGLAAWAKDSVGNVKGWGEMGYLSVSTGASAPSTCNDGTCFPAPTTIPGLTNVDQISAGLLTGFALRGQDVVAWGRNTYATLGHPANTNGDAPCPEVPADLCNGTPVKVTDLP